MRRKLLMIIIMITTILTILLFANHFKKTVVTPTPTPTLYLDINLLTTKSNLTADELKNDILRISPNSPLAQYSDKFILVEENHNVNALFLAALSIREVGWSADTPYVKQYNNIFNYHLGRSDGIFTSWDDCIDKVSESITKNYLTPGGKQYVSPTIRGMSVNYSTSSEWAPGLVSVMERLEPLN